MHGMRECIEYLRKYLKKTTHYLRVFFYTYLHLKYSDIQKTVSPKSLQISIMVNFS